jgi:hypothetical protein
MKKSWFSAPKHYIYTGLAGFLLCAALIYVIETLLTAPNDATLYYYQSQWFLGVLIIFTLSAVAVIRGIWWAAQNKFSNRN